MSRKSGAIAVLAIIVVALGIVLWNQFGRTPTSPPGPPDTSESRRPTRQGVSLVDTADIPARLQDTSWRVRVATANALRRLTTLSVARRAGLLVDAIDREAASPASGPPLVGSYVPLTSKLRLRYLGLLQGLGPDAADAVRMAPPPSTQAGREWRALALGATEASEAAPNLRELLASSRDPAVRMTAARYLGYLRDRDAIPGLRRALGDPHRASSRSDMPGAPNNRFYPVREQAARALRELGLKVDRRGDTFTVQ